MKTSLLATLIGTILAAGAAVPLTIVSMDGQSLFDDNQAGADESNLHNGHAGDEQVSEVVEVHRPGDTSSLEGLQSGPAQFGEVLSLLENLGGVHPR